MKTLTTLICLFLVSVIALAGDLNPPGPPVEGTMRTLDQVEPRIPIPAAEEAVDTFNITQSGSYYLTGNRRCNATGIQVNADNVTIDLQGYTLIGMAMTGTDWGIHINQQNNVEIRNGTVRNFYGGISEGYSSNVWNNRVINVRAMSNRDTGFYLQGNGVLVKNCTASSNGGAGIYTGAGSTVTGNTVTGNGVSYPYTASGIHAGTGSTVTDNTVYSNGESAVGPVYGIQAGYASTVAGNTVYENGFLADGDVYAIYTSGGSTVSKNTVSYNGDTAGSNVRGIHTAAGTTVVSNTVHDNGSNAGGTVYGIYLGNYSLADQNTAYNNGAGASPAVNMTKSVTGCVYGLNVAP